MSSKPPSDERQTEKVKALADELKADDDEARGNERLTKIATAKVPAEPE